MPRQLGLPAALVRFGLDVEVVPGWETAGRAEFAPHGTVGHHTAGPTSGDRPSLHVCVHGRAGDNPLPPPLCSTFLPRGLTIPQQKVIVVAAGRPNHAGAGGYRGLVGNSAVFGTEAESTGSDDDWTPWQRWAYPRVVAAQLWLCGHRHPDAAVWYCSHRTWTPRRKIDPEGIPDAWMHAQVAPLLAAGGAPAATPPPAPATWEDDPMILLENIDDPAGKHSMYSYDGSRAPQHRSASKAIRRLIDTGAAKVVRMPASELDDLRNDHFRADQALIDELVRKVSSVAADPAEVEKVIRGVFARIGDGVPTP